jgi:hypothetical protein
MVTMITTDILNLFTIANGIYEDFRVHAMGELEVEVHLFLTAVPGGGEWLVSRPGRFTPRERAQATR